jgi:hypothetical protein
MAKFSPSPLPVPVTSIFFLPKGSAPAIGGDPMIGDFHIFELLLRFPS